MAELIGKKRVRTRLKNRLSYFEWNGTFDPSLESPESPDDFEFNISRIVKDCINSSVSVVMLRPKANSLFLPGVGKGNFIFYRFLGLNDKLAKRVSMPDARFLEALGLQETGKHADAAEMYRDILLHSGVISSHLEFPLIVVNNYAVNAAEKGNIDEAEVLFNAILKERGARKEIILYNLAQLYRIRGDNDRYQQFIIQSNDADQSMYRIRTPYLEAFDRVAARFGNNVQVVDLSSLINDEQFVDHTHPVREGQETIAGKVMDCLKKKGISGSTMAVVENVLYNPELSMGNTTEFFRYYRTYDPFNEAEIAGYIDQLKANVSPVKNDDESAATAELPDGFRTALDYHLLHPAFPSLYYLVHHRPQYPSDVGRFPEYFLCRYLIPYLKLFESEQLFARLFSPEIGILRKSEELRAVLPGDICSYISDKVPYIDVSFEGDRLPAILNRCRKVLLSHLHQGNQIYNRMKTTIYWYFRESLRYGSHSRTSMRYERTILEFTAEALAVASILNLKLGAGLDDTIKGLIKTLEDIVMVHDQYCGSFGALGDSKLLLEEYDRRLAEIADRLEKE